MRGPVVSSDSVDGIHFSAETNIKLGHAPAEKVKSIFTSDPARTAAACGAADGKACFRPNEPHRCRSNDGRQKSERFLAGNQCGPKAGPHKLSPSPLQCFADRGDDGVDLGLLNDQGRRQGDNVAGHSDQETLLEAVDEDVVGAFPEHRRAVPVRWRRRDRGF
jgi:hypothetical protein